MAQGYLNTDPDRCVRVRVAGERGFLTIKGPTVGITRAEFEYDIPLADATGMLSLCANVIKKTRHYVPRDGLIWEVDVFSGANEGLVLAEVELPSEDHELKLPAWVGDEVSYDERYFNAALAERPFTTWE